MGKSTEPPTCRFCGKAHRGTCMDHEARGAISSQLDISAVVARVAAMSPAEVIAASKERKKKLTAARKAAKSGGSSAAERRPSKPTVEGSTPSPRSKVSGPSRKVKGAGSTPVRSEGGASNKPSKKSAASPKAKDRPLRGKALSRDSAIALSPSGPADRGEKAFEPASKGSRPRGAKGPSVSSPTRKSRQGPTTEPNGLARGGAAGDPAAPNPLSAPHPVGSASAKAEGGGSIPPADAIILDDLDAPPPTEEQREAVRRHFSKRLSTTITDGRVSHTDIHVPITAAELGIAPKKRKSRMTNPTDKHANSDPMNGPVTKPGRGRPKTKTPEERKAYLAQKAKERRARKRGAADA